MKLQKYLEVITLTLPLFYYTPLIIVGEAKVSIYEHYIFGLIFFLIFRSVINFGFLILIPSFIALKIFESVSIHFILISFYFYFGCYVRKGNEFYSHSRVITIEMLIWGCIALFNFCNYLILRNTDFLYLSFARGITILTMWFSSFH